MEKKINLRLIIAVMSMATLFVGAGLTPALAYTIDGSLLDWGVDLTKAGAALKGFLDKPENKPTGGRDIDVVTEDNTDIYTYSFQVGPGWSLYNKYDAEAMYFDNDFNTIYLAIVTGLKPGGDDFRPGDIFLDINSDTTKYEYGLNITDSKLYSVKTVKNGVYNWAPVNPNPWAINATNGAGKPVSFVYNATEINGHYVMEAAIPLVDLGLVFPDHNTTLPVGLHWTMGCGNDYLNLNADANAAPEPATLTMLGLGLLGVWRLKRKKA